MAILKNLLDAVEETSPSLRHVTFYQGGKAYGADLGPFKTPAREDDPRLMPPNFYYDQEDFLRQRQQGEGVALDGAAPGSNNRLWSRQPDESWDVDCRLCRHLKGTRPPAEVSGDGEDLWNFISNHLGRDSRQSGKHLWPRIAAMFDLPAADPIPTPLTVYMADKKLAWEAIVRKHGLPATTLQTGFVVALR